MRLGGRGSPGVGDPDPVGAQPVVLEHALVLEEDLQVGTANRRGRPGGRVGDADLRRGRDRPDVGGGEAGTSAAATAAADGGRCAARAQAAGAAVAPGRAGSGAVGTAGAPGAPGAAGADRAAGPADLD